MSDLEVPISQDKNRPWETILAKSLTLRAHTNLKLKWWLLHLQEFGFLPLSCSEAGRFSTIHVLISSFLGKWTCPSNTISIPYDKALA